MRTLALVPLALLGLAATQDKTEYSIKGEAFEACECESVCPCVWTKDATFAECRGCVAFSVKEGRYGGTDLKGVVFAIALVHSDKNMLKGLGHWEGVLYVPDQASADQKKAVEGFFRGKFGGAFAKLDVKSAAINATLDADRRELTIGKAVHVKIAGMKTPEGKVPMIENPPFSLYPRLFVAKAEVNTYDDAAKWDFSGRNAFYGPFEYTNK